MVIEYLFGFERYIICHRCPGAVRIITWAHVSAEFNKWNKCGLCSGLRSNIEPWYTRWKA